MRRRIVQLALAAAAPVLLTSCMSSTSSKVFSAINTDRVANGVKALRPNDALNTKAEGWASHLLAASNNVCSSTTLVHSTLSDGKPANSSALAENVGCMVARVENDQVISIMETGFMNSPGHRTNILNPTYTHGGAGYASKKLPNGTFLIFETHEFAQIG